MLGKALFTGVFTVLLGSFQAENAYAGGIESVTVRLAQTGADGNFSLALIASAAGAAPDAAADLTALTSLCKMIRVFGRVEPNSGAAGGHLLAMAALKKVAGQTQTVRFKFANAGLKVANKTLPCALRSHGILLEKTVGGDVFRFAVDAGVADKTVMQAPKSGQAPSQATLGK